MIDDMFKTGQRLDVKLAQQVPVYRVYVTAWALGDGVVNFRNDIYGLDGLEQFATAEGEPAQLTPAAAVGPAAQPAKAN